MTRPRILFARAFDIARAVLAATVIVAEYAVRRMSGEWDR